jgi:uncharacterized protein YdaU (DUF1376 family)
MSAPYMPIYVGDYLADTQHLTATEHGAYLLLLMCMWRAGGVLPNDEMKLSRCAKLTMDKWRRIAPTVLVFFTIDGAEISHKRISKELSRYEKTKLARGGAGLLGNRAKVLKRHKPVLAFANPLRTQPEPEPEDRIIALTERDNPICGEPSPSPADWQASPRRPSGGEREEMRAMAMDLAKQLGSRK